LCEEVAEGIYQDASLNEGKEKKERASNEKREREREGAIGDAKGRS